MKQPKNGALKQMDQKNNLHPSPTKEVPQFVPKMVKFRCLNVPGCGEEFDIPKSQADAQDHCPYCASTAIIKVENGGRKPRHPLKLADEE